MRKSVGKGLAGSALLGSVVQYCSPRQTDRLHLQELSSARLQAITTAGLLTADAPSQEGERPHWSVQPPSNQR